jgi:hypothetical protein
MIAGKPLAKLRDFFGANIAKDRKRAARAHGRVSNGRTDFQRKVSRQRADENQAVAAQRLKLSGLMKHWRLSAAMAAVGGTGPFMKIEDKPKRKGGRAAKLDRRSPFLSKRCAYYGPIKKELKLSDREWPRVARFTTETATATPAILSVPNGLSFSKWQDCPSWPKEAASALRSLYGQRPMKEAAYVFTCRRSHRAL